MPAHENIIGECSICHRLVLVISQGQDLNLIHEFKNSYLVLGDHQFFKGYSVLLLKDHYRELHDLEGTLQQELLSELMKAGKAVFDAFKPWKMNYSCYGNQVPHVHWHIFPRYESDPDRLDPPWLSSSKFVLKVGSTQERAEAITAIRAQLQRE